jgi:uncharacterized protein YaiL (DUF2058 family)
VADSLRDQLLKAGLATTQRARQAQTAAKQSAKRRRAEGQPDDGVEAPAAREAAKRARDRELNQAQERARAARARRAQLHDLIRQHRLNAADADIAFNFVLGQQVKRLYVTAEQQRQLSRGGLVIAWVDDRAHLLPAALAERLRELDPALLLYSGPERVSEPDPDDPYAAFPVPDDLRW